MAEKNEDLILRKKRHNAVTAIALFSIAGLIALAIIFVPVIKTGNWNDIGIRLFLGFVVLFWAFILYGHLYQF